MSLLLYCFMLLLSVLSVFSCPPLFSPSPLEVPFLISSSPSLVSGWFRFRPASPGSGQLLRCVGVWVPSLPSHARLGRVSAPPLGEHPRSQPAHPGRLLEVADLKIPSTARYPWTPFSLSLFPPFSLSCLVLSCLSSSFRLLARRVNILHELLARSINIRFSFPF